MGIDLLRRPGILLGGLFGKARERGIEVTGHLMYEVDRGRNIDPLNISLQQRNVADPGFVLDLDGVVTQSDDQISGAKQLALYLPARAFDAAERQRVFLADQAFGHGGGGKGQTKMLDRSAQPCWIAKPHGRCADDCDRPSRGSDQVSGTGNRGVWSLQ
jgi:hypothetical protein